MYKKQKRTMQTKRNTYGLRHCFDRKKNHLQTFRPCVRYDIFWLYWIRVLRNISLYQIVRCIARLSLSVFANRVFSYELEVVCMLIYRQQRPANVKRIRRVTRFVCICIEGENDGRKLTSTGSFKAFETRLFVQIEYFPYADKHFLQPNVHSFLFNKFSFIWTFNRHKFKLFVEQQLYFVFLSIINY